MALFISFIVFTFGLIFPIISINCSGAFACKASDILSPELPIMQTVSHTSTFSFLLICIANYLLQKLLQEGVSIMRLMVVK
jgi:nitrate reductase NapE component